MRINHLLLISFVLFIAACNNNDNSENKTDKKESANSDMKAGITEKPFGTFEQKPVTEYTITNSHGMQVSVINYGGTVTKLITPDKSGNMGDVVTGFESLEGFLQKGDPYFGALIGRYGNRIANGKFTLDGTTYQLAGND